MAIKPARIDRDGKIITSDRLVNLSLGQNDEVEWTSVGNQGPWTIVFTAGSPFSTDRFPVPQRGQTRSGTPTVKADPNRRYKYQVQDENGAVKDDPDIEVDI